MSLLSFSHIVEVLKGMFSAPTDQDKKELFEQTLLLTLSRATAADTNIATCEIETVVKVFEAETSITVEAKDVRIAAKSEMYEERSLESLLGAVRAHLGHDDHLRIVKALAAVIRSDDKVSPFELEFFNKIVGALGLSAGEVVLED